MMRTLKGFGLLAVILGTWVGLGMMTHGWLNALRVANGGSPLGSFTGIIVGGAVAMIVLGIGGLLVVAVSWMLGGLFEKEAW